METTVRITGMMCGHCETHVKKALEALPGVRGVTASHEAGTAVIMSDAPVDAGAIRAAVQEAGYEVEG